MDPLSGVASVIAVVQLAQLICGVLKVYFRGVREARADIDRIFTAIKSLERILAQAERLAKHPHSNDVETFLVDLSGPMGQLKAELDNIRMQLETPSLKGRLGGLAQSLRWPFRNKEVEKSVHIIEQHKSTLSAHLGFEILEIQINQFDIITSIQQDIKQTQDDRDHKRLVQWLANSIPDPSREHNAARSDYEESTGSWLIDSEELRSWSSTRNSFMWLHGAPGAGKSMLCSSVIESLKARCRWHKPYFSVVVYWYFSFASRETQSISNFLCSIARDLCSKVLTIPKVVEDLWLDANNGQQRPSVSDLLSILRALLPNFDDVYLVVDAIDEYPRAHRDRLLRAIWSLISLNTECLHLLAVSRPEADIQTSFKEIGRTAGGFREVKVQGTYVRQDIEKYLDHRLHSTQFRNWSTGEKRDIKSILTSQADDMFRLVSLQLERLGTLLSRAKRREALHMLPKTLDAFYHRLLEDVDDVNQDILKKALIWLLLSARPLTVAELAEAVIISPTRPFFDPEERFDDEQCILAILPGGFVKLLWEPGDRENFEWSSAEEQKDKSHGNPGRFSPTIQLAHHSVKDYLLSSRVARPEFKTDCVLAHNMLKEACMAYLVYVAKAPSVRRQDPFHEFAFLHYVSTCWPYHITDEHHDEVLARHIAVTLSQGSLGINLIQEGIMGNKGYLLANELRFTCSSGSPCEQCTRLSLRRQWALLRRFNDSNVSQLESLSIFLVPAYLTGHFTQAKVEDYVLNNGMSWGTYEMHVRMSWGYWKPLEADVVALTEPSDSRLGYQYQMQITKASQITLVRRRSPPLGIPLAALSEMGEKYRRLGHEIVTGDLDSYVLIAYDDQDSDLPERLLEAVCSFYRAILVANQECDILCKAIEIHVTFTILERSLILDAESMCRVQGYLQEKYPPRSAAYYATRQIKFAMFLVQRKRIFDVLKDWENLMWRSNKSIEIEHTWATSFSVLVMLILAVDKTLGAAYYFCEGRIKHHNYEAMAERREFRELVRLTQTELFERCKEIFHSSFKTRKGGKEACNPIRDGIKAFRRRSVKEGISRLVWDLQAVTRDFGAEIRSHRSSRAEWSDEGAYTDAGRLASIFLGDFLE